ncbi:MAG TPA: lamin tail domain-containing protein [Longimicrobium sp.]|nr:lamin tail domain-containing protein [Longimicrobium sp.]
MRIILKPGGARPLLAAAVAMLLGACSDLQPVAIARDAAVAPPAARGIQAFDCTASARARTVSCKPSTSTPGNARADVIGGQNTYLKLTSSNVSYDAATDTLAFDVTVQNLMNETIGTADGVTPDPQGIQVFFNTGPNVTVGSGTVIVANQDGTDTFTASNQPYFAYNEILAKDEVSDARRWKLVVPEEATSFTFTLLVETDTQYLLVINEVMTNPPGIGAAELPLEWFEVYNAGTRPVQMQNLVIADSAASGRRPYHKIASSLVIPSGGYAVLGTSTNTTDNGGAPVDYAYAGAFNLANSVDAIKISRLVGPEPNPDTVTVDRTQYGQASVSAKEGISRELKNPALDNSNMDGSNWDDASVTSVYGAGGRGTPKAQNSVYVP